MKKANNRGLFKRSEILGFAIAIVVGVCLPAPLNRITDTFLNAALLSIAVLFCLTAVAVFFWVRNVYGKDMVGTIRSALIFSTLASLTAFSLLTTVPLNVDRSFSVWMLSTQTPGLGSSPAQISDLKSSLSEFFAEDSGEISRRVNEQLALGNIVLGEDGVNLSSRGEFLVQSLRGISRFYGLNRKYTFPQEHDD